MDHKLWFLRRCAFWHRVKLVEEVIIMIFYFIFLKKRYQVKKILNNSANGVIYQGIIAMTSFLWRHLTLIPGYRKTDGQLVCVKQVPKSRVHQVRDLWTKTYRPGSRTGPDQDWKQIRNLGSNRTVRRSRYQVVPHGDRSIPKEFQMHIQASTCNKVVKVNLCRPIKVVYHFFTRLTDYTQSSRRFTLKSWQIYCAFTVTVNPECQILDNSSKYFSKILVFQVVTQINFWKTHPFCFRKPFSSPQLDLF